MKLIIAGSREFNDYKLLASTLEAEGFDQNVVSEVVSGCAHGADRLGEKWATSLGILVKRMPADWVSTASVLDMYVMVRWQSTQMPALYSGMAPAKELNT